MTLVTVDTITLRQLDWLVAIFERSFVSTKEKEIKYFLDNYSFFNYSADYKQAGKIIENNKISVSCPRGTNWNAEMWTDNINPITGHHVFASGETFLIAAMRCYVKANVGDQTVIPDLLIHAP